MRCPMMIAIIAWYHTRPPAAIEEPTLQVEALTQERLELWSCGGTRGARWYERTPTFTNPV